MLVKLHVSVKGTLPRTSFFNKCSWPSSISKPCSMGLPNSLNSRRHSPFKKILLISEIRNFRQPHFKLTVAIKTYWCKTKGLLTSLIWSKIWDCSRKWICRLLGTLLNLQPYPTFRLMARIMVNVIVLILTWNKAPEIGQCHPILWTSQCHQGAAGVRAVTVPAPSTGQALALRKGDLESSSTGRKRRPGWIEITLGTLAEKIWPKIDSGTMADLSQKNKWKRFLTTRVAWTKSIILKRSVHQKLSKYLKSKSFKGAQARVATSALHASAIVMRTCK
jgi:hypothetical protein